MTKSRPSANAAITLMLSATLAAGPASAAAAARRHTWYMLNYSTAKCELSANTPEEFQTFISGPFGHMAGKTAEIIEPSDVSKDAYGDIMVRVRANKEGSQFWDFFTSKDSCDLTAKTLKPVQAPSDDIN
jgi:hypothetical protein